jgi:hypothetical protein
MDVIDDSIVLDSDGTKCLEYCTYCNEWGHDTFTCEFTEDEWRPIFTDNDYDL